MGNNLVFIYGTLQREEVSHYHLKDIAEFIAPANTISPYPLVMHWNLPYLLPHIGFGKIVMGELYNVTDQGIYNLDVFENVPMLYTRGIIGVTAHGKTGPVDISSWVYFGADITFDTKSTHCLERYTAYESQRTNRIPSSN